MGEYRNFESRRQIIRAILAEGSALLVSSFELDEKEEVFFRARAAKALEAVSRQTGTFKSYYTMPTGKPFRVVALVATAVMLAAIVGGVYTYVNSGETPAYPVYAALIGISAAAAGWWVGGGIVHRNTIRQNTSGILFARFTQAPFSEAMHRFHFEFGYGLDQRVTKNHLTELRSSKDEAKWKAAASVPYLLNYFESIACGVANGDLNGGIVEKNVRGLVIFYHDKCQPYIRTQNAANPKVFEHLIKLRQHYRDV